MPRHLLLLLLLVAFSTSALLLGGCPKKSSEGDGAALPNLPGVPKVAQSGDKVTYSGKDEKGNAVSATVEKQGEDAHKTTVKTEKGTMVAEVGKDKVAEKDLGVAFYPGATVEQGLNAQQTGKETTSAQVVNLKTADPYEKVASFYKGKYAKGNSVVEAGGSLIITIGSGKGAGKMILVGPAPDKQGTQIVINSTSGR